MVAGVVVCTAGLLAGCGSDDVDVDGFQVTAAGQEACPGFLDSLPEHVSDQTRRTVTGSASAAAWGDPAIVLRCGVGRPDGFDRSSTCQSANGVDWFVPEEQIENQSADVLMTTIGRSPRVEVRLPADYRPPVAAMVDLGELIKAHTTVTGTCH